MPTKTKTDLPPLVVASDLEYPKYDSPDRLGYSEAEGLGNHGELTFYKTTRLGWCLATLGIAKGKNGYADRTYGICVDTGTVCRVGKGPHVTATVTVHLRKSRLAALKKYTDLYTKGLTQAGEIRDRISSRRAQGQLMRTEGRTSWWWDR